MKRKMEKIDSGESVSGTDYELLGDGGGGYNIYVCFQTTNSASYIFGTQ